MSQPEHFAALAARYDELRPVAGPTPLHEALEVRDEHVLDVGCGTGATLAVLRDQFGCTVAGVDASPEMLARARAKLPDVDLRLARAEELPFEDATFDAAVMVSVIHHLDRSRALPEVCRVLRPGGRLVVAVQRPESFWFRAYFPRVVELERQRMPNPEALEAELAAAGFARTWTRPFPVPRVFSREEAIAKVRGRAYSTLALLSTDEYRTGLEHVERELPETVDYVLEWTIVVGER